MLEKHIKSIVNALCVVFMQRSLATPHNALSVRNRPLSRNCDSSYLYFGQIGKRSLWTMKQADKVYLLAPKYLHVHPHNTRRSLDCKMQKGQLEIYSWEYNCLSYGYLNTPLIHSKPSMYQCTWRDRYKRWAMNVVF